jgi:uncharacterized protein (PEP-CTERM system associated)
MTDTVATRLTINGCVRKITRRALLCLGMALAGGGALAQTATGEISSAGGSSGRSGGEDSPGVSGTIGTTGPISAAPSLLSATGSYVAGPDVRVDNLGGFLVSGVPPAPAGGRAWDITPRIGLTEEYSSSGNGGSGGGAFISTLLPSVAASVDTSRLHSEIFYAPQIEFYVPDDHQNRVNEAFNGRLLATLVPQTMFLDLRGSAAVEAIAAGQAPSSVANINRDNTTQNYDFAASPYALHRFGPWGTGEIGGLIARSTQNAQQSEAPQTAEQMQLASLIAANNQNVTTYGGHLAFVTGEAFSRYNGTVLAQATRFDGSGVLDGAYRDTATVDHGYAVTRNITALATIGYERIEYAGTSPIRISDAIWNVGFRLTPNPTSSITVRYGHKDGLNAASVDAGYQATARTRIYVHYSTGLTTETEQLQNALATSDLDSLGNPVDHATGAPLVNAGNFFGSQNSLFRSTIASVTGTLQLNRDSVSVSVTSQSQTLISASNPMTLAAAMNGNGLGIGSSHGVYGSATWSHELRPNLQSTLYGQYGVVSGQGTSGTGQLVVVSAVLSYSLSKTLLGQLQYSYSKNSGADRLNGSDSNERDNAQNLVLVSLVKSF